MSSSVYTRNRGAYEALSFVRPIAELTKQDKLWLLELSNGKRAKELTGAVSEQIAKNRLQSVRMFLGAENTTNAVAKALRQRIIR